MKKKLIALTLACVLSLSLVACGSNADTKSDSANTQTEGTETTATTDIEVSDVQGTDSETPAEDTETEAPANQTEAFTLEDGLKKVAMIKDAYNDLTANSTDKELETAVLTDYKGFLSGSFSARDLWVQYADGETLMTYMPELAVGALYLDNYINQGTGYYDFTEWLGTQDVNTILNRCGLPESSYDSVNSDDVLMVGTFLAAEFLSSCSDISGELSQSSDYTIAGVTSAYAIALTCDDKTGGVAVFDADGNLLNIVIMDGSDFQNAVAATLQ